MSDLDDAARVKEVDPSDFLGDVERFPDQVREALRIGGKVEDLPSADGVNSIAVLGMGGSGISGDVLTSVLRGRSQVFVGAVKGYDLPRWVGPSTLVFACSYSGNTEETLSAFEQAKDSGARIVAVTTGGKLMEDASSLGLPHAEIPAGLQPRAALGYLTVPMIVIWERMTGASELTSEVEVAADHLEERARRWGRQTPAADNRAKALGESLVGRIPIIYGSEGVSDVAAYRWKCQFNECSKSPAWWHTFSELDHNEIVGWGGNTGPAAEALALIVLRHPGEHPRNSRRVEITLPLIEDHLASAEQVVSDVHGDLGALLDLIYLGDFVATYLAIAKGVDPAPVEVIEGLKKQLAE